MVLRSCGIPAAMVDNHGMAHALEAVVGAIDALTEPQNGGPGVVLTLGGLVISRTIILAWQCVLLFRCGRSGG
jgi:hypothetical protein